MSLLSPAGGSGSPEIAQGAEVTPLFRHQHPVHCEQDVLKHGNNAQHSTTLFHGRVPVGKGEIDWTLEVPQEPKFDGIGMLAPGYLGIKQSSRAFRHALASEHGIANLTYRPDVQSDGDWREIITEPQQLHAQALWTIAADLRFHAGDIKKIPGGNKLDTTKLLMLAHSMGGLAIPRFTYREPGSVYKMVGLMTCGFGFPTIAALGTDAPSKLYGTAKHEVLPAYLQGNVESSWRNISDMMRYVGRLRFMFEGLSCLRDDMRPIVSDLAAKGIEYDYLAAKYDWLVRPDASVSDHVSSHKVIENGGHLLTLAKPSLAAAHVAESVFTEDA